MKNLFKKSLLVLIGVLITSFTTQMWATDQTFDGNTYIYWYLYPGGYSTWGDGTTYIQLKEHNGDSYIWKGFYGADDTADGWGRYLVPAGTYCNVQLHTTKDNAYTRDDVPISADQQVIYDYGTGWTVFTWRTTYFARNSYVYFDNSNGVLNNTIHQILLGRTGYPSNASKVYKLKNLGNTKLWYYDDLTYNNYQDFYFISNSSEWSGYESSSAADRIGSASRKTASSPQMMDHSSKKYNLFVPNSTSNGTALSHTKNSSYTSLLESTQGIEIWLAPSGSTTYTKASKAPAQVQITSYKFNNSATATTSNNSTLSAGGTTVEGSAKAVRTATTQVSYSSMITGYEYMGMYSAGTGSATTYANSSTSSYTYYPTAGRTTYVRFRKLNYTVSYDDNEYVTGYTSQVTSSDFDETVVVQPIIAENYVVASVTTSPSVTVTDNGDGTYSFTMPASNTTVTIETVPADVTLTAKVVARPDGNAHGTIQVNSETPTSSTSGEDYTISYNTEVTFTADPDDYYHVKDWLVDGVSQGVSTSTFAYTLTANTTVSVEYAPDVYNITYKNTPSAALPAGTTHSNPATYTVEDDITLTDPTLEGATFIGWYGEYNSSVNTYSWKITKLSHQHRDTTIYAHWTRIKAFTRDMERSTFYQGEEIEVSLDIESDNLLYTYSKCYTLLNEDGTEASRQPFFDTITYSSWTEFTADVIGTYKLKVELIPNHGGCAGAVAATAISSPFTVEPTQTVLVQFLSDGEELITQRTYTTSANALQLTLNANKMGVDTGFVFHHWEETQSNITVHEGSLGSSGSVGTSSITITASGRDTLKAIYKTGGIFFKNTLGWSNVFLYRHNSGSYWTANQGTGTQGGTFTQMTKIKNSPTGDIYYVECSHTNGNVVSFVDQGQNNYKAYSDGANVVYRQDYDGAMPMFVPVSSNPSTDRYDYNYDGSNPRSHYYRGFWTKYHPNSVGYEVRVYDKKVSGSEIEVVSSKFADDCQSVQATANLEAGKSLGFMFAKAQTGGGGWAYFCNGGDYAYNSGWMDFTAGGGLCGLATKAAGDYVFTITSVTNYGAGTDEAKVQGKFSVYVDYPAKDGDYRLVYRQGEGKEGMSSVNTVRPIGWYHESDIIPAGTSLNYREVYIDPTAEPELKLQTYTISSNTWADTSTPITFTDMNGDPYDGIDDLSDLTETGVYQFMVNTLAGKVSINYRGKYTGDFYIRTNGTDKYKWDYKKSPYAHLMTYSEYSSKQTINPFTHYYVKDLDAGTNVRFTVATENTAAICDTIYNYDGVNDFDQEKVPGFANVRFMYNESTNHISRAVLGASTAADFLNIQALTSAEKLYKDANGTVRLGNKNITISDASVSVDTLKFTDRGNWIYETTVYAMPGAAIKLTATYSTVTQYFKGQEGSFAVDGNVDTLIGGTGSNVYPIHITYDYKINRLLTAWMPDTLKQNLAINADLMLVREHQKDAEQVILGKTTQYTLSKVKTVYGVMHFNKWTLNNRSKEKPHVYLYGEDNKSEHERGMYLISFPFDVDLIDVFGFGEYGRHWIIEYYDGKGRAKNGYWIDSEPNWKFVTTEMRDTFKLNANEGYVLALDLDYFSEYSNIWQYVEDIYLYFPSTADIGTITSTNKTINFLNQSAYKCEIKRNKRDIKDSYWHCIGVPSFANANHRIGTDYDESGYVPFPNIESWSSTDLPFVYTWHMEDNTFEPMKAAPENFKATHAYLVQYSKDTMLWRSVNNAPDPVLAPVMARQNNRADYDLQVELWKGETKQDQTLLRLSDDANVTSAFEFNYDLCKENNAGVANLWTMTSDEIEVAGNSMPYGDQSTIIPVGVKINTSGDYTFAIPEGTDGVGVVLLDNVLNTRTNLALTNYTVNLASGTINGRFYLEISPISQSPTAVEALSDQQAAVRKVMVDGVLYIVRDGKVFNATGTLVK